MPRSAVAPRAVSDCISRWTSARWIGSNAWLTGQGGNGGNAAFGKAGTGSVGVGGAGGLLEGQNGENGLLPS